MKRHEHEPPPSDSERRTRIALRTDLVIAVCALLVSVVVAASAVYQTRVIANQLTATVWPYLSFRTVESDTAFRWVLINNGLGPAVVHSAHLALDGKAGASLRVGSETALRPLPKSFSMSTSSLYEGDVIRPGESVELMRFGGARARVLAAATRQRIAISVCYCSLLDQCWTLSSTAKTYRPQPVARCAEELGFGA